MAPWPQNRYTELATKTKSRRDAGFNASNAGKRISKAALGTVKAIGLTISGVGSDLSKGCK